MTAQPLPGLGVGVAGQLREALAGTVGKSGHLPSCGHGQWLQTWSFDTRHECDVEGCDRTGQPCSKRCAQVRAALRLDLKDSPEMVNTSRAYARKGLALVQAKHTDYQEFLDRKQLVVAPTGIDVPGDQLHPALFPFQRDLTRWALRKGRSALFADTGLGKTLMQLAWAQHAAERVLILAPLAVARQTVREGDRFGIQVTYARSQEQAAASGITITNYEMLDHFDAASFGAVVLDESSILKSFTGKVRTALIRTFAATPLRLCCTATPAPNDIAELANHAEFLGIMSRAEMLARFFVFEQLPHGQGTRWRLKGHAQEPFYRWLASWSMAVKRPSDIGYDDAEYDLPPLTIEPVIVATDYTPPGQLFVTKLHGVQDRSAVRRDTLADRVQATANLVMDEPFEPWLIWCGLNDEGRELQKLIPGAVLVEGSDSPDVKAEALTAFAENRVRVLVTKCSIAGFGMNFQHCAHMAFCGLSDSYEQYYQAIRRCWRFGQEREVKAYVVLSEPEEAIYQNVLRKEDEAQTLSSNLVQNVAEFEQSELAGVTGRDSYTAAVPMRLPDWLGEHHAV